MNSDSEFYENKEYEVKTITIHPQYHPGKLQIIFLVTSDAVFFVRKPLQ